MSETLTAPIEDKIEFVTADEAKKLDKMMGKRWVKVDEKGKPIDAKKYFYEIISCHPYEKKDVFSPLGKMLIKVEVQKFHRKQFGNVNVRVGNETKTQEQNQKVESHRYTGLTDNKFAPGGAWELVDEDANRQMDIHQFKKEFIIDTTEE